MSWETSHFGNTAKNTNMTDSSTESKLATAKTVLSTAASIAATAMVARSVVPEEFDYYLTSVIRDFLSKFSNQLIMVVDEYDGLVKNHIYESAVTYLATKVSSKTRKVKVSKPEKEKNIVVKVERDEEIVDIFDGIKFKWVLHCKKIDAKHHIDPYDMNTGALQAETRHFELSFHKKYKDHVINSYLPHIVQEAKILNEANRTLKIYTLQNDEYAYMNRDAWTSVNLDHPCTFDTLALEAEMKENILNDLKRFVKRKDYYRKVGKAWKRGYLLYGPPGTGKSSLIAAMANYLNFDVYDLELTEIKCNSDLRKLLLATANKSILVVEDIDCTIQFQNRSGEESDEESHPHPRKKNQKQVTLSGFLNFIDGLWSSCGDERIIVFTTNHKEKLDPALLRPGRMDVHIHLSYCTSCGFKLLAANYLGIKEHLLFEEIGELITDAQVTPAEVAEELMKGTEADKVLEDLVEFLQKKIKENEEALAKKNEEEALGKKNGEESAKEEKEKNVVEEVKSNEHGIEEKI